MQHIIDRLHKLPRAAWITGYLALICGGMSLMFRGWAYDDPFITYRYADNLRHGLGMVYNPGERVLSTTTPLFTMLLALMRLLWSELHSPALLLGSLSLGAGGLSLWFLLDHPQYKLTRWVGLLFYPLFPLVASTLSSETPLYLALCLGAFACYHHQRYRLAAIIAALAALTRPDGALVGYVLGMHALWSHPPQRVSWKKWLACLPWRPILLYLSIGGVWVLFAWMYYGSPIPATLYAKQQQAIVIGSTRFLPGLLVILSWYSSWVFWIQVFLGLPGMIYGLSRLPVLRWLAAWTGLYFIAYSILGVTRYYWYYAPLVPLLIISFGMGLEALVKGITKVCDPKTLIRKIQPQSLVGILVVVLLVMQFNQLWKLHLTPDPRWPIYQATGQWLKRNTPPEATVGALEVGMIGYYAQRTMIDFAGLIQPLIAIQLGKSGSYAGAAYWAIDHYDPDFLVLISSEFPDVEADYLPGCRLEATFAGDVYKFNRDISIYSCP